MKYAQLQRFFLIDGILYLKAEGISSKEMLEQINSNIPEKITLRQLQKDLHYMKEYLNAPIVNNRGQRKVRYKDVAFCVFNRTREPYKIDAQENALGGRLDWLRLQISYVNECFYKEKYLEVIDYDDNFQLTNINTLPTLLKAILNERTIRFAYSKRFSNESSSRIVHPYFLHQYNNRWYLFALYMSKDNARMGKKIDSSKDGIRCFALDRISDVKEVNVESITYQPMSMREIREYKKNYFGNIVGVMNDGLGEISDMDLVFDYLTGSEEERQEAKLFYNLLKSNPFYPHFQFMEDEEKGQASASIYVNPELENHLIQFAHAGYISNDKIRESIVKRARQILFRQHAISSEE